MKNEQTFFVDLYGYEDYRGEELSQEALGNGDYLDCDNTIDDNPYGLANHLKKLEEDGTLVTELFVKLRVLRDNPIFDHLAKGGKVKLEII